MSPEEIEAIIKSADEKFAARDFAGVEALLDRVLAEHPAHPRALMAMSGALHLQRKSERLIELHRAAVAAEPTARNYSNLGMELHWLGDIEGAVAAHRAALAAEPSFLVAHANIARAYAQAGRDEEALAAAQTLLDADPGAAAWEVRAEILRTLGRHDEAVAATTQGLRFAPEARRMRQQRAALLEETGRHEEALSEWEALAREGVDSPELAAHLARALQTAGRRAVAAEVLEQALRHWPTHVGLHAQSARLKWVEGERDTFTAAMEAALAAHPKDVALRAETAQLLLSAGKIDQAERLLRDGLARSANEVPLLRGLVAVLGEQGRLDEAWTLLEAQPLTAALMGDRAVVLLRLGRAEESLKLLRALPRGRGANQQIVALEAIALRVLRDPEYGRLYDMERFVRTYDVAPPSGSVAAFNAELVQRLRALHDTAAHPLDQTLRGGTQTGRDLRHVDDPVIKQFLAALDAPIRAYIAALSPDDPLGVRRRESYKLSGCWSVRLKPGGFHVNHVHDRGWISSAYYVDLPPDAQRGDTQAGWIKFGEPPWPLEGCGPEKIVRPKVGMLVLFPSYMWHGTIPFAEGAERLTAAFDVVPQ